MLARTRSVALVGTEARLVDVEVDTQPGVPTFRIVGLPAKSVTEAEQRTRSALLAAEYDWPKQRIVANLAPGALRKEGTHFDLPLALGILVSKELLPQPPLDGWIVVGELALDGSVRQIPGVLAAAILCRQEGFKGLVCPAVNAAEGATVQGIEVVPVRTLQECIRWARGLWTAPPVDVRSTSSASVAEDMRDVRGQVMAKKALEIAAAGGHNLLLLSLKLLYSHNCVISACPGEGWNGDKAESCTSSGRGLLPHLAGRRGVSAGRKTPGEGL